VHFVQPSCIAAYFGCQGFTTSTVWIRDRKSLLAALRRYASFLEFLIEFSLAANQMEL
jgi:hypothetical protein